MKTRLLFVPLLFALVAFVAACGGSSSVPASDIAMVGNEPITLADFNTYLKSAVAVAGAQGQNPLPGTPQYAQIRDQVIAYLVQVQELEQQAPKEDVSVSQQDVTKYLANLAKTSYGGSMGKLEDALKKQGLTMATAREEVYVNLLAQKIHDKVTKDAKVTLDQERQYYTQNIAQYTVPAETTREVRHILVKTKYLANQLEQQVTSKNFARLAKRYSTDTTSGKADGIGGSAANGGKLTAVKGQLVPEFQDVVFGNPPDTTMLKTGQISQPVHSKYGWHIIQALGPVKDQKAHTPPFSKEEATIKSTLLQQAQDQLWQQWLSDLKKQWEGKVRYQKGYAPPPTTALPTTT